EGLPIVQVKFCGAQICACAESLRAKQMCRYLDIGALALMLAPKGPFKLAAVVVPLPYGLFPAHVPRCL
ncbi:unnamed protein product, partial [Staurois parvus]